MATPREGLGPVALPAQGTDPLKAGDRIKIELTGTVLYVGETDFSQGVWVGIELDTKMGKHNGTVMEKQYFICKDGHGVFMKPDKIRRIVATPKKEEPRRGSAGQVGTPRPQAAHAEIAPLDPTSSLTFAQQEMFKRFGKDDSRGNTKITKDGALGMFKGLPCYTNCPEEYKKKMWAAFDAQLPRSMTQEQVLTVVRFASFLREAQKLLGPSLEADMKAFLTPLQDRRAEKKPVVSKQVSLTRDRHAPRDVATDENEGSLDIKLSRKLTRTQSLIDDERTEERSEQRAGKVSERPPSKEGGLGSIVCSAEEALALPPISAVSGAGGPKDHHIDIRKRFLDSRCQLHLPVQGPLVLGTDFTFCLTTADAKLKEVLVCPDANISGVVRCIKPQPQMRGDKYLFYDTFRVHTPCKELTFLQMRQAAGKSAENDVVGLFDIATCSAASQASQKTSKSKAIEEAEALVKEGRVKEAIFKLSVAIECDSKDIVPLVRRAELQLQEKLFRNASEDAQKVIRLDRSHARAWELQAEAEYRRGAYKSCLDLWTSGPPPRANVQEWGEKSANEDRSRRSKVLDAADKRALDCPEKPAIVGSVESLVKHLTTPFESNPLLKYRVLFRWLCDRVSLASGGGGQQTPDTVLKSREATSNGYTALYKDMCDKAGGLECKIIWGSHKCFDLGEAQDDAESAGGGTSGTRRGMKSSDERKKARSRGHADNSTSSWPEPQASEGDMPVTKNTSLGSMQYKLSSERHFWVAIRVQEAWQLLDPAWASGHIENGEFVKHWDEFWWMTPPDKFIYSHFPSSDPRMCLLDESQAPKSIEDFWRKPCLKGTFFRSGLEFVTDEYAVAVVKAGHTHEVKLREAKERHDLIGSLSQNGRLLEYAVCMDYDEAEQLHHIQVNVPDAAKGYLILDLYSREVAEDEADSTSSLILQFCLEVEGTMGLRDAGGPRNDQTDPRSEIDRSRPTDVAKLARQFSDDSRRKYGEDQDEATIRRQQEAATKIQAVRRGSLSRKQGRGAPDARANGARAAKQEDRDEAAIERRQSDAATRIQAARRGSLARQQFGRKAPDNRAVRLSEQPDLVDIPHRQPADSGDDDSDAS